MILGSSRMYASEGLGCSLGSSRISPPKVLEWCPYIWSSRYPLRVLGVVPKEQPNVFP